MKVRTSQVAPGIYHMDVANEKLSDIFSVYLIREDGGALVEPGPAANSPGILQGLAEIGYDPTRLQFIVPTHIHLDHGGGTGLLAQKFPQAKVVIHPEAKRHMVDPSRLIQSTKLAFGDDFEDSYGPIIAIPESQLLVPQDGEIIKLRSRELQVIYSPGHAPHHLSILDRKSGGLFCGEALGVPAPGSDIPIPFAAPPGFDLEVSLATMEKLKALQPRLLFYSHGPVGREPERLIAQAQQTSREFGDFILSALRAGKGEKEILEQVKEYLTRLTGNADDRLMPEITVAGYVFYYKRRGLA